MLGELGRFPLPTAVQSAIEMLGATVLPCLVNEHHGTTHVHRQWNFGTQTQLLRTRRVGPPGPRKPLTIGATRHVEHLVVPCTLSDGPKNMSTYALVNSAATSCFMNPSFAAAHGILLDLIDHPDEITVIDSRPIR